jgi:uncharacterized protein YndB with AHSA1/START domain
MISVALLLLLAPAQALDLDWQQIYEVDGITGSRAEVPDSKFYAFKGVVEYDVPPEKVLHVLMDNEHRLEWVSRLYRCEVVEQLGPYDYVLYQAFDLPPPFSDRDYVYRGQVRRLETGEVELSMRSVEHPDAPETVGVRATLVDSRYVLTPIDGGARTRVVVEIMTDPNGVMPAWLVNIIQRNWPVDTLSGIRDQFPKPHVASWPLP